MNRILSLKADIVLDKRQKMRDYRSIEQPKTRVETKVMDIPSCRVRQTRRKRRTRPAVDRFHDLYEYTGEMLGQGAQGAVQCYLSKKTGVEYAVKIINKTLDYDRKKILKEIDIFHHCQGHENILQLNEFFEEDTKFYLVFDKIQGGSLFDQIGKRGQFTELEASKVIKSLAEALAFLHHKGIAHRDIKPENILCETEDSVSPVRICDFDLGNAIVMKQESPVTTPELLTPVGSLEYMAPEVVDAWVGDAFSYDKKCDIWSLGIILYTMLCGYPPFYASCGRNCGWEKGEACKICQEMLFDKIQDGAFDFPSREWSHISTHAKDLIRNMLVRNPADRYSADDILRHPWISEPVAATCLATPGVLSRNSSSQLLDTYAENAMAFNRMILSQLTISESRSSSSSSGTSHNPFFSPSSSGSDRGEFFLGSFSDDEEDEDSRHNDGNKAESLYGTMTLRQPSSKLAQRRLSSKQRV